MDSESFQLKSSVGQAIFLYQSPNACKIGLSSRMKKTCKYISRSRYMGLSYEQNPLLYDINDFDRILDSSAFYLLGASSLIRVASKAQP